MTTLIENNLEKVIFRGSLAYQGYNIQSQTIILNVLESLEIANSSLVASSSILIESSNFTCSHSTLTATDIYLPHQDYVHSTNCTFQGTVHNPTNWFADLVP